MCRVGRVGVGLSEVLSLVFTLDIGESPVDVDVLSSSFVIHHHKRIYSYTRQATNQSTNQPINQSTNQPHLVSFVCHIRQSFLTRKGVLWGVCVFMCILQYLCGLGP